MRIALCLLFLLLYRCCFSQYESQFQKFHTTDSVKNIKVWYFDHGTPIDYVRHQGYRYYTFGKHGKVVTSGCIDQNNELVWQYQYDYDSLNRRILEIYNYKDKPTEVRKFTYNKENQDVKVDSQGLYSGETSEMKEDKDGNIIEVKSFRYGKETKVDRYEYTKFDKRNNWIEMVWYRQNSPFRKYVRELTYY